MLVDVIYFIENLTLRIWIFSVLPKLVIGRWGGGPNADVCYFVDGSKAAEIVAITSARFFKAYVCKLEFYVEDQRDSQGRQLRNLVFYGDLRKMLDRIRGDTHFQSVIRECSSANRLSLFLSKIASLPWDDRRSIWKPLMLIQTCNWKSTQLRQRNRKAILFLERRPWMNVICEYANEFNLEIISSKPSVSLRNKLKNLTPRVVKDWGLYWRHSLTKKSFLSFWRGRCHSVPANQDSSQGIAKGTDIEVEIGTEAKIIVQFFGQLNLDKPELHSELHFWQSSDVVGSDLTICGMLPSSPLNDQHDWEIRKHHMSAVAAHPGATLVSSIRVIPAPRGVGSLAARKLKDTGSAIENRWMRRQVANYWDLRGHWLRIFEKCNAKIFVTWNKFDASHCAIADAMERVGGITAIYQRAFEAGATPETSISADVAFGYSKLSSDIERESGSHIPYYVITGYIGDHRFSYWRKHSEVAREKLIRNGAERIIAFLDENTSDDPRWSPGHHTTQRDYEFLLKKVIDNRWMGLLVKPKVPGSLRERLGPVAEMLRAAEATGRCFVYEEGTIQGSYPPASAALAADVAIHSNLVAATAGLEMSLSGVPTLLMDHEGWDRSPLYQLGEGKVVFRNWDHLWYACQDHWSTSEGDPEFGNWSDMLPELDPFRDGRAAERMGTYLGWLLEGFKENQERRVILEKAADRYRDAWGEDKVVNITDRLPY